MDNRVNGLNFMRIIATFHVLAFHTYMHGAIICSKPWDYFIIVGAVGCTVFFVLSGYSLRTNNRYLKIKDRAELKYYFIRRISSIYPVYLFLIIVQLIISLKESVLTGRSMFVLPIQLSLLQSLVFPELVSYWGNDNFWYLSVLFVLYILFPFLNELTNLINKWYYKIILLIATAAFSEYVYYLFLLLEEDNFYIYYMNPFLRVFEFACGILIADLSHEEKFMKFFKRSWMVLVVQFLTFYGVIKLFNKFVCAYNLYNVIIIPYVAFSVFFITNSKVLNKWGGKRIITYVSSLGLTIYMCQTIAIMVISNNTTRYPNYLIYPLVTVVSAIIVHEVIEKPCKKWVRKSLLKSN